MKKSLLLCNVSNPKKIRLTQETQQKKVNLTSKTSFAD